MDSKVAIIAIIVEDYNATEKVNAILHGVRDYVVGRQGIPYKQRNMCVISVVLDAPIEVINGVSGKLGMIDGVTSKVLTTK